MISLVEYNVLLVLHPGNPTMNSPIASTFTFILCMAWNCTASDFTVEEQRLEAAYQAMTTVTQAFEQYYSPKLELVFAAKSLKPA